MWLTVCARVTRWPPRHVESTISHRVMMRFVAVLHGMARAPSTPSRCFSAQMKAYGGPLVVALDYDGCLIDSEPELTQVAWRTARRLWPEKMDDVAAIDSGLMDESAYENRRRLGGQPLGGQVLGADGLPKWLGAKMRLLRPLVTNEHEALLLLRLCADEAGA